MAPATFRRISTNVPGKRRFIMGFDINPGTFGRIRPKVACENFLLSYHQIIIEAILQMHFPENGTRHFSKNFDKRPGETAIHNGFRYKSWDVWPNSPKSGMWKFSVHPSENFSSVRPIFFFVFWRFIELQASYRAQIKTVDRSRRPGKKFKCMLGACAPKKLQKTSAKVRSRGRWHARSVENPPYRSRYLAC